MKNFCLIVFFAINNSIIIAANSHQYPSNNLLIEGFKTTILVDTSIDSVYQSNTSISSPENDFTIFTDYSSKSYFTLHLNINEKQKELLLFDIVPFEELFSNQNKVSKLQIVINDFDNNAIEEILVCRLIDDSVKNLLLFSKNIYNEDSLEWLFTDNIDLIGNLNYIDNQVVCKHDDVTQYFFVNSGKFVQTDSIPDYYNLNGSKYYCWGTNLRVRKEPRIKSEVIGNLSFENEVFYLNNSLPCEVPMNVGGLLLKDAKWMQVKTSKNVVGWVYSPYLVNIIEIGDIQIVPKDNVLTIIDRKNNISLLRDTINTQCKGIDYGYIQGVEHLYIYPYIVLMPYAPEKDNYFHTYVFDMNSKTIVAKFFDKKNIQGISANQKYILFKNNAKSLNTDLYVYSIEKKRVIDKISPYFYQSWRGDTFSYYVKKIELNENDEYNSEEIYTLEKFTWQIESVSGDLEEE